MFTSLSEGGIICVTARRLCPRPLAEQIERVAAAGVRTVILREKDLREEEYFSLAEEILRRCRDCGVNLIVHNFPKTAKDLSLDCLHMPLPLLSEELCREFSLVGSSVHSVEEAKYAQSLGASYLTAGHIFATDCKRGLPPRGLDFLREVCRAVDIPVYAIGGVNRENLPAVLEAGAAGGCVMSGLMRI